MPVRFHPHAQERMVQRGATEKDVVDTVTKGERFQAKYNRVGFRRNFVFGRQRRNEYYKTKQVEAYAVREHDNWLIISVIVRYF